MAEENKEESKSSVAVAKPKPKTKPAIKPKPGQLPLFNVVLLDDDDHSYDYVIEMLQRLFCFSVQQAYEHAVEVDSKQRTVLITCGLSEAEFGRD